MIRRSGVTLNVIIRKRSVQMPVLFRMSSIGFALKFPAKISQTSHAMGTRQTTQTAGLKIHQRLNLGIIECQ